MANSRLSARSSKVTLHVCKPANHLWLLIAVLAAGLASSGCKKAVVPNVVQQDLDQAKQTLAAAQLKRVTPPPRPLSSTLTS